jgi:hypothetical protein
MRAGARFIDLILRSRLGVYEFSFDPECILRLQVKRTNHGVKINGRDVLQGDPILVIHLWNEKLPRIPKSGADLRWALQSHRLLNHSFKLVAREMQNDTKYESVRALYGASALFSTSGHIGGTRMMQHFGFTVLPYHARRGRFGIFWQNFFSWWLMYTYNDASLRTRDFWGLERTEIWMLADEFIQRYGETEGEYLIQTDKKINNKVGLG